MKRGPEAAALAAANPHGRCERHRAYRMTCDDWAHLSARAAGHCEICGIAEADTGHKQLHIDHDHLRGDWAVRGLICSPCNQTFREGGMLWLSGWPRPSFAKAWYLAHPWVDERFGTDALAPRLEPPVGSFVAEVPGWRVWVREGNLWSAALRRYYGRYDDLTWHYLNRLIGPHRLVTQQVGGLS